ncbi:MAG: hypothetical protein VB855_06725 [Pirellulaceae bacterium]
MAYRASNGHFFSAPTLLLGVLIALLAGCSQARQSIRTVDTSAPKPGYVQIPPCDRPSFSLRETPSRQELQPPHESLSRRERYTQRASCLGCGDVFWNSWKSDPPRPQDRISFHHPAEIYRRVSPAGLPANDAVE